MILYNLETWNLQQCEKKKKTELTYELKMKNYRYSKYINSLTTCVSLKEISFLRHDPICVPDKSDLRLFTSTALPTTLLQTVRSRFLHSLFSKKVSFYPVKTVFFTLKMDSTEDDALVTQNLLEELKFVILLWRFSFSSTQHKLGKGRLSRV